MSDIETSHAGTHNAVQAAFDQGRQTGLAIGALAMSIVAFISLLGIEKAILAAVLGVVSLRGLGSPGRRYAVAAVAIAIVYAITFAIVLGLFHDKLGELVRLMQQLG